MIFPDFQVVFDLDIVLYRVHNMLCLNYVMFTNAYVGNVPELWSHASVPFNIPLCKPKPNKTKHNTVFQQIRGGLEPNLILDAFGLERSNDFRMRVLATSF